MLSVGSSLERMGELASPDASVEKCRARKGGNGSICIGDMAPRGDWVETEFAGMIRSSRLLIPNICYTCAREGRPFNVRTCTHGKKGGSEGREDEEAG